MNFDVLIAALLDNSITNVNIVKSFADDLLEKLSVLENQERFLRAFAKNSSVRSLNISDFIAHKHPEFFEMLFAQIKTHPSLEDVTFFSCGLGDLQVKDLAQCVAANRHIYALKLASNLITAKGAKDIALAFQQNKTLRTLNLSNNNLFTGDADLAISMLARIPYLACLDISENNLRAEHLKSLADCLQNNTASSLHELNLAYNHLQDEGIFCICRAMEQNTTLLMLDISNISRLDSEEANVALGNALKKLLTQNKILERLNLESLSLKMGALLVVEGLSQNSTLLALNFAENNISKESYSEIATALRISPEYVGLADFSEIRREDEINHSICRLEKLNISNNFSTLEDTKKIFAMLMRNDVLQTLGVSFDDSHNESKERKEEFFASIQDVLVANHSLTSLFGHSGTRYADTNILRLLDRNKKEQLAACAFIVEASNHANRNSEIKNSIHDLMPEIVSMLTPLSVKSCAAASHHVFFPKEEKSVELAEPKIADYRKQP